MRLRFTLFILLFTFFASVEVWAQITPLNPQPGTPQQGFPGGQDPMMQPRQDTQQQEDGSGRKKLIDDSTKMVYGPKTTLYFLEKDVKRNRIQKFEVDTLLTGFHYYEPNAKSGWKYQDLGNTGSAAIPIFYQVPKMIGTTSGFHVYDLHYHSPDSVRYYDTKSPYTSMNAFFGGGNRNQLDLAFARNVNPRWNVGFNLNTIRATKVLNPNRRDDHLVEQTAYSLHTNYKSENERYFLLANFSRMKHIVNEQGGIISPDIDTTSILFAYEDAKVWLRNSQAIDLRQDAHLYHEYELAKGWQLYHVFDRRKQDLTFTARLNSSDSVFFNLFNPDRFFRDDTTQNANRFTEIRNEVGFKGDIGPLYYNAFLKFRSGRMQSPWVDEDNVFNELFLGGALRGDLGEKWRFEAEGEILLPGAFRIEGLFVSPWLEASYTKALYKPTAMQQIYAGNHHIWENDFSNIGVDQIQGVLKLGLGSFQIRPNLTLNRINNFVYFDTEQQAAQAEGEAFMVIPGLKTHFQFGKKLFWDTESYYTLITGDAADVFRIPEIFVNSRIFFDTPMFDENLFVQIGFEGRFRSDNFAYAYNPAIQQFFLQNEFNVFAYPVVDFFINARINRARVLLRMNHININLMNEPGYFMTPYFTGLRRLFDIGISWPLFD